jgi:hypothetical protein
LKAIHQDPTGQVALYDSEDHYLGLLGEMFGRRFFEYRRRWQDCSQRGDPGAFPLSLDLAINSGCQLHCLMCPLKSRPDGQKVRLMDETLFQRLLDQAREYQLPAMTLGLGKTEDSSMFHCLHMMLENTKWELLRARMYN